MIIDFHTHIGSIVNKSKEDLLYSLDESKIDKSVIFAGKSMGFTNEQLIKAISNHPDRLLGACSIALEDFKNDYLYRQMKEEFLQHDSIIGMKFYTGYQYFYPSHEDIKKYLQLLSDLGKVVIFHMGDTYTVLKNAKLKYAQPLSIDEVAVDFPNLKIVIAHAGYPWHRDTAEVLYKNDNVYADISGFVYGDFQLKDYYNFQKVLNEIEMIYDNNWNRVLFGTDWPISNQQSYCSTLEKLGLMKVFSNNTEQLIHSILNK